MAQSRVNRPSVGPAGTQSTAKGGAAKPGKASRQRAQQAKDDGTSNTVDAQASPQKTDTASLGNLVQPGETTEGT